MRIRQPQVFIEHSELVIAKLNKLERAGRICYQTEPKDTGRDAFLAARLRDGHESLIEHEKVTVVFICDRGVSHEIVRHRIAAYSQESTRYCNYANDRFGNEIAVIEPFFFEKGTEHYDHWLLGCNAAERYYLGLLELGASPQEARSVLPNSLKTEIVVTYNLREWRHFFKLRCAAAAHPQMRQIAIPTLLTFKEAFPVLFESVGYDESFPEEHYAEVVIHD